MAAPAAPGGEGKSKFTYQRRMVPMIGGTMFALYLGALVVLCISCASTQWVALPRGHAQGFAEEKDLTLGLWKGCEPNGAEQICMPLEDFVNSGYHMNISSSEYGRIKAVRGLQVWCILITLLPVPLVYLAMTRNMTFGMYAHAPVVFWLVFWIPLTVVFRNTAHSIMFNSAVLVDGGEFKGYNWNDVVSNDARNPPAGMTNVDVLAGQNIAQFYSSGAFLNFAALALMLMALLVFWASYFLCFQVDVYDENGEKVDMEELMRKRTEKPEACALS